MRLNSMEVKRQNKIRVLRYLLSQEQVTRPDIADALRLSIPTVGQITNELMEAGLARENGAQASSGGRRAMTLCADDGCRFAAGIDITKNHVDFAVINLRGTVIANQRLKKPFGRNRQYERDLRELYADFIERSGIGRERILGLGVSLPGIISKDQSALERSHILGIREPLPLEGTAPVSYPVRFFNDATAACMAECYLHTAPESFTFLSLRNSVGGATVIENRIVEGQHCRNGEVGHMCIVPGGRKCYCGRLGHYDPYGSALLLSDHANGSMEEFFAGLKEGEEEALHIFEEYLDYLAMMICNIHVVTDLPVMIGGYVGKYLGPWLPELKARVEALDIFEDQAEYIHISHYGLEAAAVGAARYHVEQFIEGYCSLGLVN